MTKRLDKAIETVRKLPASQQDEIAQAMLDFAGCELEPEGIEPDALPGVLEGLADIKAGRFATDEEVAAAYRRFEK